MYGGASYKMDTKKSKFFEKLIFAGFFLETFSFQQVTSAQEKGESI